MSLDSYAINLSRTFLSKRKAEESAVWLFKSAVQASLGRAEQKDHSKIR